MSSRKLTLTLAQISLFSAMMCVCAYIYIPLFVPITMQTFVMFLALFVLGGRDGSLSILIYIMMGVIGLPVFSGFSGGVSRLFDATGGYIFGMLFGSLVWWLFDLCFPRGKLCSVIKDTVSILTVYTVGTLWYTFVYGSGAGSVTGILVSCVLPFIIPDALKILAAHYLARRISSIKQK